jgi:hypothetical protein
MRRATTAEVIAYTRVTRVSGPWPRSIPARRTTKDMLHNG